MPTSEKERMLNALFPAKGEGMQTVNVKFFLGDKRNVGADAICREFSNALEQEKLGHAKRVDSLDSGISQATIEQFLPQ